MRRIILAIVLSVASTCAAQNSIPDSTGLVTDSDVTAVLESGGSLYAGGGFEYIGSATGSAVLVNQTTGTITTGFPRVEGNLLAVIPDGTGGWYLGGSFSQVAGTARAGVARITAALALDATFSADVVGTVRALELTGGVLYLGGTFTSVSGQARSNLAAVDASSGAIQSWNPGANSTVYALETDGSSIYAGGNFSQLGGSSRNNAGAVSTTGTLTGWQPPLPAGGEVRSLLLDGATVYIGGGFTSMTGFGTRNRFAAVDATTGTPLTQLERIGFSNTVHTMLKDGNRLYCGGSFQHGSTSRDFVANIDLQGVSSVNYPDTNGAVDVAVPDGAGGWYIGGDFTEVGSTTRYRVAHIDNTGNLDTSFVPNIGQQVRALVLNGSDLYVAHGSTVSRLDSSTGALNTAFSLSVGGTIYALHLGPNYLYVGGSFSTVTDSGGSFGQGDLVDVDPQTGNRVQTLTGSAGSGLVRTLAGDGTNLFVGGSFGQIGGVNRSGLAAIDMSTGIVTGWNPNPNDYVTRLQVEGSELLVGGTFYVIAGAFAPRLARFDLATLNRLSLSISGNGAITQAYKTGSTLYLAGSFTQVNGQSRLRAAAIDLTTGALLPWNPRASVNSNFTCLTVAGNDVMLGCTNQWFEPKHECLAAIDLAQETFEQWNPAIQGGAVNVLYANGSSVFFGGTFERVDGQSRRHFAASDATSGNVLGVTTHFSNSVEVILGIGGDVLCTGAFRSAGGVLRNHMAEIDLASGNVTAWTPTGVPSVVNDMVIDAGTLYYATTLGTGAVDLTSGADIGFALPVSGSANTIALTSTEVWLGGTFTNVGYYSRIGRAIYDASGPAITSANPNIGRVYASLPDGSGGWYAGGTSGVFRVDSSGTVDMTFMFPSIGTINDMRIDGNTLFVGGDFTNIGGAMRNNLAAIDLTSATVMAWDPAPDQIVHALEVLSGRLFVTGVFDNIAGSSRAHAASFDVSTLTLNSWQPAVVGGYITSLATDGTSLFASGFFNSAGGSSPHLAQLDPFSNNASSWTPSPSAGVSGLAVDGNKLYVGGSFTTISGTSRQRLARYDISTLALDGWMPSADDVVSTFAFSGTKVLIGGSFGQVNGQATSNLAELDTTAGGLGQYWPQPSDAVRSISFSGGQVMVGGAFSSISGTARPYLASFNRTTGQPTGWMPQPNGVVNALSIDGGTLYCGGAFTSLTGQTRNGAGSFTISNGNLGGWDPDITGQVQDLHISSDVIYLGGNFTAVAGKPRRNFTAVDKLSGADAGVMTGFDSTVFDVWESGGVVVAGGQFLNGGISANSALLLNPSTGALLSSQPQDFDGTVLCATSDGNGGWFIGGGFTRCNGLVRRGLVHINSTGMVDAGFDAGLDGIVRTLLRDGNTLYIGGDFLNAGGLQRDRFAAINLQSGATYGLPTSLQVPFDDAVRALAISGTLLYVGGSFSNAGGVAHSHLARIDLAAGTVDTAFSPSVNGTIHALAVNTDLIMAGGSFSIADTQSRTNLAAWGTSTLTLSAWNPSADALVYSMATVGTDVLVGGSFSQVGFQPRNRIARVDADPSSANFAQATSYNPDANGSVHAIAIQGGTVYLAGSFSLLGGMTRERFGATDLNGTVMAFSASPSGTGWAVAADGSAVLGAGDLGLLNQQARTRAACVTGGVLNSWQPAFSTGSVRTVVIAGGQIHVGGSFQQIGQLSLPHLAHFDCPPLIGNPAVLPPAVEGSSYSYFLTAAGGQPAYTWSAINLPGWLSLNTTTGELTGTVPATAPTTLMFDVVVTDQGSATDQIQVSMSIVAASPVNITTPATLPDQYESFPVTGVVIQASGGFGTLQWSLSGAPSWLTIDVLTGQLMGTPPAGTAPATVNFSAQVIDGLSQVDSQAFQFDVPAVATLAISTTSPLTSVNEGSPVSVQFGATGGVQPYTWSLQNQPSWLNIDSSTGLLTGTPPIGTGTTTIQFDVSVTDVRTVGVTGTFDLPVIAIPQPTITTTSLPLATIGVAWQAQINVSGGTPGYTYELLSGPDWINVNSSSGLLTGTPYWGLLGTFLVTVRVRDSYTPQQEDTASLSLVILEAPCTPGTEGWETNKPALTTPTGAPTGRHGNTAIWTGSRLIVWGGTFSNQLNTGGIYDSTTDNWLSAPNLNAGTGAPVGRYEHTAVWTGKYLIVWGGVASTGYQKTGGIYDPATDTWLSAPNLNNGTGAPSARRQAEAIWTGRYMIVWGGEINAGGSNKPNTGGIYDPATDTWLSATNLSSGAGAPSGRIFHTQIWTGQHMLVWGGVNSGWATNSGALYDPVTDTWTQPPGLSSAIPAFVTGRYLHTAVWTGGSMIVWGGQRGFSQPSLRSGVVYDPAADSWTQPSGLNSATTSPVGRQEHVAVYGCGRMIVWSGTDENTMMKNDGGVYDTASDQWVTAAGLQAATNAPSARRYARAVWTGTQMLTWGGTDYMGTGGSYIPPIGGSGGTTVVSITAPDSQAQEETSPTNLGIFTITLSPAPIATINIGLQIGGTASTTPGVDYMLSGAGVSWTGSTGSVLVPPLTTSITITLTPVDDSIDEGTEFTELQLAAGSGYTVGAPSVATISVLDDETPSSSGGSGDDGGGDEGCSTNVGDSNLWWIFFAAVLGMLAFRTLLNGKKPQSQATVLLVILTSILLVIAGCNQEEDKDSGDSSGGSGPGTPVLPIINTTALTAGQVGQAYNAPIQGSGGATPYTWAVTSGALPTGLSMTVVGTPTTTLSGNPTSSGTFNFEVTLTDANSDTDVQSFSVVIDDPPLNITTTALPATVEGLSYNEAIAAVGGTGTGFQWQVNAGSLPPGLSLTTSGTPATLLSGTPTAAGTYTFTVGVTDSGSNQTSAQLSVTVNASVQIDSVAPSGGMQGTSYNHTFTCTGGFGTYTWSHAAGPMPPGMSLSASTQPTAMLVGTPTVVGTYVFTIRVIESGGGTFDLQTCTVQIVPPIVITTTTLPDGLTASAYNENIDVTGGTGAGYTWNVVGGTLPPGLSIGASGNPVQLSGTPTQSGQYNFTVEVTDSGSNVDTQALSVAVVALIDTVAGNGVSTAPNAITGHHSLVVEASGDLLIGSNAAVIHRYNIGTGALSIFAGTGTTGYSGDGGQATAAQIGRAEKMAMDAAGNVFFCDPVSNTVRRIDASSGVISTVAGNGTSGNSGDGGAATAAQLNYPNGVAVSASGDIYISDKNNHRVRVVSGGVINAFAGTGTSGYSGDNGAAIQAQLSQPGGLAFDSQGRLLICDSFNQRIRRVQAGTITTICGIGAAGMTGDGAPATAAQISYPTEIIVDGNDHIFFTDHGNHRVRRIDATSGYVSTRAGIGTGWSSSGYSGDGGAASAAELFGPEGLTFNAAGDLLIADTNNKAIRIVDATTLIINTLSTGALQIGDNSQATSAIVGGPTGVVRDLQGNLLIAASDRIRRVDATTGVITTIAGTDYAGFSGDGGAATSAMIQHTGGMDIDAQGNIYFADVFNHRIRRIDGTTGVITTVAGSGAPGASGGGFGGDNGQATTALLDRPRDVAVDSSGNLYIADSANNRIRFVDKTTGVITTIAGTGYAGFGGDNGQATAADLKEPEGVCLHPSGFLIIADSFNHRVRAINLSTSIITTWAGYSSTGGFSGDGNTATSAKLSSPRHVAVDANGNIYVSDCSNNRIRRFSPGGTISTIAGGGSSLGDAGPATSAQLNTPLGLCIDGNGDLIIADTVHSRVRIVHSP
ncbi:MAG: putative Ig domain-containing protein [Planctomycetes bacterium]|nr:putative Ig domain-containing protein [Planctomycetota bacterium]